MNPKSKVVKRIIDVFVASLFCIVFLPLVLVIFVLIKIDSRGPLFFKQERVGKDLDLFMVLKFRTMTNEKREVGNKPIIGKADGVTQVGHVLRRFKIDELPQLLNVLKGDLSLVGPRPSVPKQLNNMTDEEKRRYSVKPGLTGLAQVSGNIHLSWKERYQKDLEYVDKYSFINDVRILIRTIFVIIRGEEYYLNKPINLKDED
jgi:lipopolysaccharide/colanic/teichoic acid biosynthesis glycosyltransferase